MSAQDIRFAGRRTFQPPWWSVPLVLLLAGGMVWAGCWQYQRGVAKQALLDARAGLVNSVPLPLRDDVQLPKRGELRRVWLEGRYLNELTVLLDNQPQQKAPGVHAWTPMELDDGRRLVVDRGWLPLGQQPSAAPTGAQKIDGDWRNLPVPGLRLGKPADLCAAPRPKLVNYPDLAAVRCLFGPNTIDGLLELSADAEGGFSRDWARAGANEIPPSRHYAYAAQWWLFAVTLLVLFIKINLKTRPEND